MISYRIKEDNEDPLLKVIEKTGQSYEFTMADVLDAKRYNDKIEKEIKAQMEYEKARMHNIKENHPEITEMEGVKLTAAKIYLEASEYVEKAEEKLKEISEIKGKMVLDLMDIYAQLPELAPKEDESPKEQE